MDDSEKGKYGEFLDMTRKLSARKQLLKESRVKIEAILESAEKCRNRIDS